MNGVDRQHMQSSRFHDNTAERLSLFAFPSTVSARCTPISRAASLHF